MRTVLIRLLVAPVLLLTACDESAPTPATASPAPSAGSAVPTATAGIEAVRTPIASPVTPTAAATQVPSTNPTTVATPPAPTAATPLATATPAPGMRLSDIQRSTFESPIAVPVGSTVTWTNQEDVSHTVSAVDGSFDSPFLAADGRFSHTFTKPGRIDLFCRVHAGMTGVVVVR